MATNLKNLSVTQLVFDKRHALFKIGIVVSEWNTMITGSMLEAARAFLIEKGVLEKNIHITWVPGSFELPLGASWLAPDCDAVITIGCVIQGETRHFDFICDACAQGIMRLSLDTKKPIIFGVLTTQNVEQAQDRSGGKHGNKGIEAAETALKMLRLQHHFEG